MLAIEILDSRFPDAMGGLVAGSTARGEDTATSDIDFVVVLPGAPAPMRSTERHHGRLVEFFVQTETSSIAFLDHERGLRRSPLLHMLATGEVIKDTNGHLTQLRDLARHRWDAGPAPLGQDELDDRRYRLTALLDDLADELDPIARTAISATIFSDVADLALISRGAWSGAGRWLVRRLRDVDATLARQLHEGLQAATFGDPAPLLQGTSRELNRLGGPLREGYERHA